MLIVLEGVDASGKATHAERLCQMLIKKGVSAMKITFPDYESPSSSLVKMYLGGSFGNTAEDVSPYAASAFYAVDRYASHVTKWGNFLRDGGVVVADRYVTSNMIHQAAKIDDIEEKNCFLDWIYDFEYKKLGLPIPDHVIFLDMPPEYARELMRGRKNKITKGHDLDIHEKDSTHIEKAYENAVYVANRNKWSRVECVRGGLRPIYDITCDIMKIIKL